jgi:site-specific DNA-methyltransferase (adenine-specific)
MVVNIEDAGFEIRDQIMWLYGSGFPKSLNIGKAVDKLQGNQREVVGVSAAQRLNKRIDAPSLDMNGREVLETKGNSPYEGWGTALKPANEPICVARKPLSEKSVAENVLKWGTGGINIDGCRVGNESIKSNGYYNQDDTGVMKMGISKKSKEEYNGEAHEGRFPANIILECICDEVIKGEKGEVKKTNRDGFLNSNNVFEIKNDGKTKRIENYGDKGDIHTNPMCPCYLMDEQSVVLSKQSKSKRKGGFKTEYVGGENVNKYETLAFSDKGGASRFFYQAKVSKAERNMGLDVFEDKEVVRQGLAGENNNPIHKNSHPTVKPVALMAYLCRLITPPNGIVLDPFMGSGSTGIAAQLEGFRFCGMEMDKDYFKIAEARIENFESYRKFHNPDKGLKNGNTRMASRSENSNSIGLGICKK